MSSSSLRRQVAGLPPPPSQSRPSGLPVDFRPLSWEFFFEEKKLVRVNTLDGNGQDAGTGDFCVYFRYSTESAKDFLHYDPVIVFLHGGGFSGLTWARTIQLTSEILKDVQMIAIDLRGHGETQTNNDANMPLDVLTNDTLQVIRELTLNDRPLIFVGHSLGGALATNVTKVIEDGEEMKVLALIILDIVEGSAMDALPTMRGVIRGRPVGFESVNKAIEWSLKTGQIKDHESARVSMPGQLKYSRTGECASKDVETSLNDVAVETAQSGGAMFEFKQSADAIQEENEDETEFFKKPVAQASSNSSAEPDDEVPKWNLSWRVELVNTEPYWHGWFHGLSQRFLQVQCPKLLLLAGVDRLDRELTVAQMQGKFQMHVLPSVGHAIQEDAPSSVAEAMSVFLIRHRLASSKSSQPPRLFPGC